MAHWHLFKFIAWFLLPLLFCARDLDRSWFTFHGWRRVDFIVLGVALVGGIAAMMVVAVTPGLRAIYPSWGQFPLSDRLLLAGSTLLWTLSWLAGWEFMHRYWMARRALAVLPRWGWLIIPVSETIYHLQKPWPETLAMLAFSLALTPWAIARRNALLPFTAHLIIELELIVFLAIV